MDLLCVGPAIRLQVGRRVYARQNVASENSEGCREGLARTCDRLTSINCGREYRTVIFSRRPFVIATQPCSSPLGGASQIVLVSKSAKVSILFTLKIDRQTTFPHYSLNPREGRQSGTTLACPMSKKA